jgi:thioredoxin 1
MIFITRRSVIVMLAGLAASAGDWAPAAEFQPYDAAAAQKTVASGQPVVVHVYASWCLQCHIQAHYLDALKDDPAYRSVTFFRIDYDNQRMSWRSSLVCGRP